jgi:predicted amidophosphoribosyltransferase
MNIVYARKYVSPRGRPLTPEERETRRLAYALKVPTAEAIAAAARELAPYVPAGAVLIPIPTSVGDVTPNRALADAILRYLPAGHRCRVLAAIARGRPVESSTCRRRRRLMGLTDAEHGFVRTRPFLPLAPTFFVDNVVTTGATLRAARAALGYGDGLVFADAGSRRTLPPPPR